jgi:hypothetical protein
MIIIFETPSDRGKVSDHSIAVIESPMTVAGVTETFVTSVQRSPFEQARAMYENCFTYGVESQFKLYGPNGDAVVQVFVDHRAKQKDQIIAAMQAKILDLGPANVSHHCADPKALNVIDISASRMTAAARMNFHLAIKAERRIAKYFDPFTEPSDPAFHLEVKQS